MRECAYLWTCQCWSVCKKCHGDRWNYGSNAQERERAGNTYLGLISLLNAVKEPKDLWYPKSEQI